MTTVKEVKKKFSVCSKISKHTTWTSTSAWGSTDLDTRPPSPQRSTIDMWVQIYPRALSLMESGKVNVKSLITERYKFEESIEAFEYAANPKPTTVKVVIEL